MKQAIRPHNINPNDSNAASQPPPFGASAKKRSFWDRFMGGGTFTRSEPGDFADEPEADAPMPPPLTVDGDWDVSVPKPARTPLDAFKDTISEGTRLFCEENVHPLYVEDKQTKFRVTGIKLYAPQGANQLMSILENLPIDVRNRMAKLRAQNAPGAAEQLVFDDGFFGISLDIAPVVIDGQQICLLASWTGGSVEIKLVFTGQYITVKAAPSPQIEVTEVRAEALAQAPAKTPAQMPFEAPTGAPAALAAQMQTDVMALPSAAVSPPRPVTTAQPEPEAVAKRSKDTPLGVPARAVKTGSETPMIGLSEKLIGRIHILPFGEANETVINITASMLPYMLGRDHDSTYPGANGYSMGSEKDDTIARLVSREHFELKQFEAEERRFYVVNHAVERNGSYFNGCAVPERFSFRAEAPKNTFVLGGVEGVGTARITVEAV